jgi:septal ring factor EnvC (AmiA/AmiB activator)
MNQTFLEAPTSSAPPPLQKKSGVGNIVAIVLGLFCVVLLCAMAGLGYWAYTLDKDLTAARADIAKLQGEKDTLNSEKNKLTTDLNSTRSELDAAKAELSATKAELETAKADLESARSDMAALQANMDKALKYLNIFDGFWDDTYAETEVKIKATNDSALLSSYRVWENSRKNDDFYAFFDDVIDTIIGILK